MTRREFMVITAVTAVLFKIRPRLGLTAGQPDRADGWTIPMKVPLKVTWSPRPDPPPTRRINFPLILRKGAS